MRYILASLLVVLSGCSVLPVSQTFPEANQELMQKCEKLELIDKQQVTLSELSKTVVRNYAKYHNCSDLVEAWQEWYTKQKKIYEEVNE